MNTFTPDQFAATGKANVEAAQTIANNAFAGMEKLVELNLAASKAMLAESFGTLQAVLDAKDLQEVLTLQAGMFQPLTEKSIAYGRHVYAIATESSAEFIKGLEAKIAEAQEGFGSLVENMSKNAPAGSEAAMALIKTAVSASQNAIDSAKGSAKKAVEAVESNFNVVADQAVKAASSATKKA